VWLMLQAHIQVDVPHFIVVYIFHIIIYNMQYIAVMFHLSQFLVVLKVLGNTSDIFCRTMLCMRGLCCHAVSVCPSVCVSVMFVNSVKTNKHVIKFFFTILVFLCQTA